jgi:hypothetical protein
MEERHGIRFTTLLLWMLIIYFAGIVVMLTIYIKQMQKKERLIFYDPHRANLSGLRYADELYPDKNGLMIDLTSYLKEQGAKDFQRYVYLEDGELHQAVLFKIKGEKILLVTRFDGNGVHTSIEVEDFCGTYLVPEQESTDVIMDATTSFTYERKAVENLKLLVENLPEDGSNNECPFKGLKIVHFELDEKGAIDGPHDD